MGWCVHFAVVGAGRCVEVGRDFAVVGAVRCVEVGQDFGDWLVGELCGVFLFGLFLAGLVRWIV